MNASVLFGAGWENEPLEVLWRDSGRAFCRLFGNDVEGEKHAFISIPASIEHPSLESVNRLTHEHGLRCYLDSAWALLPLEVVRQRGQTMLMVDYKGGKPLDHLVRQPMDIGQFLRVAVALSSAIGQ